MSRRGENIYKRKDGRWEARYVKEIMIDGTKKYGSVYANTYREVKAKRQIKINQLPKSSGVSVETVSDLMNEWLDRCKERIKISSLRKYQVIVRNHIDKHLGALPLKNFSASITEQFSGKLLAERLSAETVNQILIVLEMGFKYGREQYQAVLPEIRYIRSFKVGIRVFSPEEQNTLVNKLLSQNDVYSFGIMLALFTGLRIGELCALMWEDISENTIHVQRTMQRISTDQGKTEIILLTPKTSSSDRVIPIPKALIPMIEQHRKPNGSVLLQENNNIIEPRLMQRKFTKLITACGLEKANFHALRHTFATRCIEAGVDVKTLSELLGHADVKTTLNRYVHSSLELKQNSVDRLLINL